MKLKSIISRKAAVAFIPVAQTINFARLWTASQPKFLEKAAKFKK